MDTKTRTYIMPAISCLIVIASMVVGGGSGHATGIFTTGEVDELGRIKFFTGTVVSGATVTISGNYKTNGPGGTYTLVK
jgi:hypothetical protein